MGLVLFWPILPMHMKNTFAQGSSEPPNIMDTSGITCTTMYCSGFPVVLAKTLLSSARHAFISIFSLATLVSMRRFGIVLTFPLL